MQSSAFDAIRGDMVYPLDINNDEQLIEFIRQTPDTRYHPVAPVNGMLDRILIH